MAIPTRARRRASLDDANSIFCLIFASSGDLIKVISTDQLCSADSECGTRNHGTTVETAVIYRNSPGNETYFVSLATAFFLILKVIYGPSALCFWEIGNEIIVFLRVGCLIHDDFCEIFAECEGNIFICFLEFERLIFGETLVVDTNSGGLL